MSARFDDEAPYLCTDCGHRLERIPGLKMLWCRRCSKRRRVPTHPALQITQRG